MVETCCYLFQCLLAGYATVLLLNRSRSLSWPFAIGFGILIGSAEIAMLSFYAALAGIKPCLGTLLTADVIAILVLVTLHLSSRRICPDWPRGWTHAAGRRWYAYLLPASLIIYVGVTATRIAISTPLIEWDAWMIWLYKAKILSTEELTPPPWIFVSPSGYGHALYPLLWPMLAAGVFGVAGNTDDHLARIVPVFLWLGWGLITYSALRWRLPRLPAIMLAALQLSLPVVTRYVAGGDADVMLAGFYAGMIYLILQLGENASWSTLLLAALLGTATAFTKNEGTPLVCFGAMLIIAMTARQGMPKAILMAASFIGMIGLFLTPWYIWSRHFLRNDEDYPARVITLAHVQNLARLGTILPALGRELITFHDFGPLWILLPIASVVGFKAIRGTRVKALWAILAAHFLLYILIYVITPMDVNWLLSNTLNRLLIHISPIAILLIGYHWAAVANGADSPSESE